MSLRPRVISMIPLTSKYFITDHFERNTPTEDPKLVVMAIKRLITASNPSLVNLTGLMAKIIGFTLMFPASIVGWVVQPFGFGANPLPEVLSKIQKPRTI